MKTKQLHRTSILVAICLTVAALGEAQKAETARNVVTRLQPRAKQWHADAVLTNLATFEASEDGTASTWTAAFYSPSTKKGLIFTASGGKFDQLETDRVSASSACPSGQIVRERAMTSSNSFSASSYSPRSDKRLASNFLASRVSG